MLDLALVSLVARKKTNLLVNESVACLFPSANRFHKVGLDENERLRVFSDENVLFEMTPFGLCPKAFLWLDL